MSSPWAIKFNRNQVCLLLKGNGESVKVRIESVTANSRGVIYGVHEIDTAVNYPAAESSLKPVGKTE